MIKLIKNIYSSDLKYIFWHLKFTFEHSKNTKYDKDMYDILFRRIGIRRNIKNSVLYIFNDFNFYIDIIDVFGK